MKKIIMDFSTFKEETLQKEITVPKDTLFYVICDKNDNIPLCLVPKLQTFPSKLFFVECDKEGKDIQKAFLLGYLISSSTGKSSEEIVLIEAPEFTKCHIDVSPCMSLFPKAGYKTSPSLAIAMGKRIPRTKTKTEGNEKKETTTINKENKKTEKTKRNSNPILLQALKKIDPTYPYEEHLSEIEAALKESLADVSLDMILRMKCGSLEGGKIAERITPKFAELKKLMD